MKFQEMGKKNLPKNQPFLFYEPKQALNGPILIIQHNLDQADDYSIYVRKDTFLPLDDDGCPLQMFGKEDCSLEGRGKQFFPNRLGEKGLRRVDHKKKKRPCNIFGTNVKLPGIIFKYFVDHLEIVPTLI